MSITLKLDGPRVKKAPFGVVYGDLRTGKTTDVVKAFPNYLHILTSESAHDAAISLAAMQVERGETPIVIPSARRTFPSYYVKDGKVARFPTWAIFEKFIEEQWIPSSLDGSNPYGGLILDEGSELFDRIFEEITEKHGTSFTRFNVMHQLVRKMAAVPVMTGRALICVHHVSHPVFHEDGVDRGKLKYPGGPKFPGGNMIRPFCQSTDFTIHLELKPDPDDLSGEKMLRQYTTTAHPLWVRGWRDMRIQPTEALNLREMIERVGFIV